MVWYKKITVEIPLYFTFVNFLLTNSILTNLIIYRSCYIILKYDKTKCAELGTESNNSTDNLEKLVQPTADLIAMVKSTVEQIVPIFVCMLAGPWSDKHGRKPVLLMSLIGLGMSQVIMIIFSYFEKVNPWYFLMASIPSMIGGGATTYFMITLSYLSDISTPETRGMRMAFYEVALASGVLSGNLSSSFIFYATNYETVFAIGAGCMLIAILYSILFVPESLPRSEERLHRTLSDNNKTIQLQYFYDMVHTTVKKRENYDRAIILLAMASIISLAFETGGDNAIQFIFLREKLSWNLTKYTIYSAAHNVLWVIGAMGGIYILHKKLKIRESVLSLVGFTSILICIILQAIASNDFYIYGAGVARCLGGIVSPMLRSLVSRMVPLNEAGKIFSMLVAGGSLISLGASPLYTLVYNSTINKDSASFNFLSIGILSLAMILLIIILTLENKSKSYPLKNEEETKEDIH